MTMTMTGVGWGENSPTRVLTRDDQRHCALTCAADYRRTTPSRLWPCQGDSQPTASGKPLSHWRGLQRPVVRCIDERAEGIDITTHLAIVHEEGRGSWDGRIQHQREPLSPSCSRRTLQIDSTAWPSLRMVSMNAMISGCGGRVPPRRKSRPTEGSSSHPPSDAPSLSGRGSLPARPWSSPRSRRR